MAQPFRNNRNNGNNSETGGVYPGGVYPGHIGRYTRVVYTQGVQGGYIPPYMPPRVYMVGIPPYMPPCIYTTLGTPTLPTTTLYTYEHCTRADACAVTEPWALAGQKPWVKTLLALPSARSVTLLMD